MTNIATTKPWPAPARADHTAVLVAEDDLEMRRLIVATLRRDRYEVIEAPDGIALLDCVEAAALTGVHLAAIVSDVRMPLLSGMDALAVLEATSADVPVILITAFGDRETHDEAHQLGAFAILDKPFDMTALSAAVAAAVSETSS
jgi:DNA-binding NtrC family response regulator